MPRRYAINPGASRPTSRAASRRASSASSSSSNDDTTPRPVPSGNPFSLEAVTLAADAVVWAEGRGRQVLPPPLTNEVETLIQSWFELVDQSKSGVLSSAALATALKAAELPHVDESIKELLQVMDFNRDKAIDWEEFHTFISYAVQDGQDLDKGLLQLPSGSTLPLGTMIHKIRRKQMLDDVTQGGAMIEVGVQRAQKYLEINSKIKEEHFKGPQDFSLPYVPKLQAMGRNVIVTGKPKPKDATAGTSFPGVQATDPSSQQRERGSPREGAARSCGGAAPEAVGNGGGSLSCGANVAPRGTGPLDSLLVAPVYLSEGNAQQQQQQQLQPDGAMAGAGNAAATADGARGYRRQRSSIKLRITFGGGEETGNEDEDGVPRLRDIAGDGMLRASEGFIPSQEAGTPMGGFGRRPGRRSDDTPLSLYERAKSSPLDAVVAPEASATHKELLDLEAKLARARSGRRGGFVSNVATPKSFRARNPGASSSGVDTSALAALADFMSSASSPAAAPHPAGLSGDGTAPDEGQYVGGWDLAGSTTAAPKPAPRNGRRASQASTCSPTSLDGSSGPPHHSAGGNLTSPGGGAGGLSSPTVSPGPAGRLPKLCSPLTPCAASVLSGSPTRTATPIPCDLASPSALSPSGGRTARRMLQELGAGRSASDLREALLAGGPPQSGGSASSLKPSLARAATHEGLLGSALGADGRHAGGGSSSSPKGGSKLSGGLAGAGVPPGTAGSGSPHVRVGVGAAALRGADAAVMISGGGGGGGGGGGSGLAGGRATLGGARW